MLTAKAIEAWNKVAHRPPAAPVMVNTAGGVATILLYGVVGDEITDRAVADALARAQGASAIRLYVNSPGGDYFMGKAIFAQLARAAAACPLTAHVDSLAASAASFLLMAAPRIEMAPEATLMVHEVWTVAAGRASDLEASAQLLRMETDNLAAIYAKRTGLDVAKVAEMLAAETWLSAQDAVSLRFADCISAPPAAMPVRDEGNDASQRTAAEADARIRAVADAHIRVARAFTGRH